MSGLSTLASTRPAALQAMQLAVAQAREACPGLVELCEARIRTLLDLPATSDDPKARAVADYSHSALFSAAERLALEFTEQYVMDVAGMPDDLVAELRGQLGTEGLYALTMALYAVDQLARLELSAGVYAGAGR